MRAPLSLAGFFIAGKRMRRFIISTVKLLAKLLAISLIAGTAVHAETLVRAPLMPRVTGVFVSPFAPAEAVSCEDRYQSVCARPCATWAGAQPDFQYSYDVCVARCPRPIRGSCR
jgi:hypothetical protein